VNDYANYANTPLVLHNYVTNCIQ